MLLKFTSSFSQKIESGNISKSAIGGVFVLTGPAAAEEPCPGQPVVEVTDI